MNEYNISDYEIFTKSISDTNRSIANINISLDNYQNTVKEMCTEDIFFGPIADNCLSAGNAIAKSIRKSNSELTKSVFYLKLVSKEYAAADNLNSSRISKV